MDKNVCGNAEHQWYYSDGAYGTHASYIAQIIEECAVFIGSHQYGPWYADSVNKVELESLFMDRNMNGDNFRGGTRMITLSEASCASIALLRGAWELPTREVLAILTDIIRQMRKHTNKHCNSFEK